MRLKVINQTNVNLYMLDGACEYFEQNPSIDNSKSLLSEAYNCYSHDNITMPDLIKYVGKVYKWLQTQS